MMRLSTFIPVVILATFFMSCQTKDVTAQEEQSKGIKYEQIDIDFTEKIERSEEEWKNLLSKQEFYVLREKGTERPFTGDLLENKKQGEYVCGACGLLLFESSTKFKSGTGWPSFYQPAKSENVGELVDATLGMKRTEVICNRCGGHLGHVFEDGPKPTGLRYCINSVSLDFVEQETKEK
jgi:peptide-methionine (R)-S-oxide reductase